MGSRFETWKREHPDLWQFVMFNLMSMITTVVDFSTFLLFNYWIFASLKSEPFAWGIIRYGVEAGGLGAFLAFAASFAISQTFNFFLQRKTTFKATNNVLTSGILYAIMVIGVYFLQVWLPSLIQSPISAAIGPDLGAMAMKWINMLVSFLIQYPMNKWVIMRQNP